MIATGAAEGVAQRMIRTACRRLPAEVRADRCQEWIAELPAILEDQSVRPSWLRGLRALAFGPASSGLAGGYAGRSRLARDASGGPNGAVVPRWLGRATWRSASLWAGRLVMTSAAIITVLATRPDPRRLPFLPLVALGIGFDAYCLADVLRAGEVRYLPRWAWVLICIAQTPAGGIAYLCVGRISQARISPSDHT